MPEPIDWTPELKAEILALLAEGKSIRSIARLEGMPSLRAIMTRLSQDAEFASQYAKAKQDGADAWADDILDLAYQALEHPEKANSYRVAIDALKWTASKLKPQKYGDRLETHVHNETPEPSNVMQAIADLEARLGLRAKQDKAGQTEQGKSGQGAVPSATVRARETALRDPEQPPPGQPLQ